MPTQIVRCLWIASMLMACAEVRLFADEQPVAPEDNWIPLSRIEFLAPEELPEPETFPESSSAGAGRATIVTEPPGEPIVIDATGTETLPDEEDDAIPGRPYNGSGWYSKPSWGGMNWRTGSGNRFGEFALEGIHADPVEGWDGLSLTHGNGFHFLGGPSATDMPPRLFDFNWGLHWFGEVTDFWWLDLGFSGGLYTDFEDSVREGWRFPAHAVASWEMSNEIQPVFGVSYFDRDNLGLLPVAGAIVRPDDGLRLELVFPEPRIAWRVSADEEKERWLSLSGRIGGGEWAIERFGSGLADVATYNEYQLVLAFDTVDRSHSVSSIELGYIFERDLEYRSGVGNTTLPETFFIRLVNRK